MRAHISNNNGKYTTWLVDNNLNQIEAIQLCDRDIPFSKYEVVEVLTNGKWKKKRLMERTEDTFYFDDETSELIEDNVTRSNKKEILTGYYEGTMLNFYFDPTGKKKTVLGENMFGRIIVGDTEYLKEDLQFSHSYFKIKSHIQPQPTKQS